MAIVESKLSGLRVLLVEDSFLVATSISRLLEDLGCRVVGPFATSEDALKVVGAAGCDVGVLDINLGGETSEAVATSLERLGVPFLFVTSYQSPAMTNPMFASRRTVHKPLSLEALRAALTASLRP
jgi:DNA-binding NarL/FixJ family response regulator